MHILGKILSVLVIGVAIASVILTTRTLQIRNEWLATVEKERDGFKSTIKPLETVRTAKADLSHQYRVAAYQWTPYWPVLAAQGSADISVQPNVSAGGNGGPQSRVFGILVQGLGPVSGIRVGEVIHAFSPGNAADETHYLGPFRVTRVSATPPGIYADADWSLRDIDKADDPQDPGRTIWESSAKFRWGNGWRIRLGLPNAEPANLIHYSQMLLKKDEQLVATETYRDTTLKQKAIAGEQLNYRKMELNGDDSLKSRNLPSYRIDGLVKAIGDSDEIRNTTLEEVDILRHQLKKAYDEVVDLQARNRKLAAELPGADTVEVTAAAND
ncbi:MAG: hypothetical protein VB858_13315 [Planctomycetaceae bacterium]